MAATTSIIEALSEYISGLWLVWLAFAIIFGALTLWYYFIMSDLKRYAPDILVREACFRNKTTLGSITDMAGTRVEFECTTDKDSPGLVKSKHVLVNPNLVSSRQQGRLPNGIATLDYVLPYHFPFNKTDALALVQTRDYVRDKYPQLDWIEDDVDIIMLAFCNSKYLFENCVNIVVSYMEMGAEMPDEKEDDTHAYEDDLDEMVDINGDEIEALEPLEEWIESEELIDTDVGENGDDDDE